LWLTGALSVQMPRNSERLVKQLTFANASAELLEAYSDRELSVNEKVFSARFVLSSAKPALWPFFYDI